jgi:Succinylglutamate desuccinylase / Aspartoacylase family
MASQMADHVIIERPRLNLFDHFPDALLDVRASELWRHLTGPSLFHLPGRHAQPLFVSVLLHGNEDSGWRAMQAVLRRNRETPLPRGLILFIGNIEAAKGLVRTLPTQFDYNRSWPGTQQPAAPEAHLMREVIEIVARHRPFASIDIHNNTGKNPHYACVNRLDDCHLHLARLFGRTVVYFNRPQGVQSAALAEFCPAVTIECGRVGGLAGVEQAADFVWSALSLSQFPSHPVPEGDLDLLRTFAIVKIPPDATFSYDDSDADFRLRGDLDHLNFSELESGASFGCLGGSRTRHLEVVAGGDFAVAGRYFDYVGHEIRLSQRAIPAMLTVEAQAVRLDCLGYLMHRIGRNGTRIAD